MSDLAQLLSIAPTTAGGFMGINQRLEEEQNAMRTAQMAQLIAASQQRQRQEADLHPLELEKARLGVDTDRAKLPGVAAKSRQEVTTADIADATKDTSIASTKFAFDQKQRNEYMSQLGTMGVELENVPPLLRHQYLAESLKQRGFPQPEGLLGRLRNVPADQLPAQIRKLSEAHLKSNPEYVREQLQQEGSNKRNAADNAMRKQINDDNLAAGKYSQKNHAKTTEERLRAADSPTKKAEVLEQAYWEAKASGDEVAAAAYAMRAQEARHRVAEDAKNRGLGAKPGIDPAQVSGLPARDAPSATAPIAGSGGAPAAPGSPAAIGEAAIKAWGRYEPHLYEYRVGPSGILQRKPKGK